jgi:cob(I)alamin adenosyltransferase
MPEQTRRSRSPVTKTGDKGETGLLYGGRVSKTDPRVEAYGTVDEAVSALGLARALCTKPKVKELLLKVQKELYLVGGELATDPSQYEKLQQNFQTVTTAMVEGLEAAIKELEVLIQVPRSFVVPGATPGSAALDLARTVARRAERRIVGLKEAGLVTNPEVVRYVNRLSDLVYELARLEAKDEGTDEPVQWRKKRGNTGQ